MKDWKEELNKRFPLPKILALSGGAGVQRDLLIHFIEQIISERDKNRLEEARNALKTDIAIINLVTGEITKSN